MNKFIFMAIAAFYASGALAAAHTAAPATGKATSEKNTATVLPDEKAETAGDKKAVKSITPKVRETAKEEADKTKAGTAKPAAPAK
jgi:hypothetical protein